MWVCVCEENDHEKRKKRRHRQRDRHKSLIDMRYNTEQYSKLNWNELNGIETIKNRLEWNEKQISRRNKIRYDDVRRPISCLQK